jgi:hypothetical protein
MYREWVDWHEATQLAKYGILLPPKATVLKGFGNQPEQGSRAASTQMQGIWLGNLPEAAEGEAVARPIIRRR